MRQRLHHTASSLTAARRWAEEKRRLLEAEVLASSGVPIKDAPTLAEFAPRFMEEHALANRHKPSGIDAKRDILRKHLLPRFGDTRLDAIDNQAVATFKASLGDLKPKTVNNVLSVLKRLLSVAVDFGVLERPACTIKLVKATRGTRSFYDFPDFERLVEAARRHDGMAHLAVLLGGQAGLRCGEMMALEWSDIDWTTGQLVVARSEWEGQVTATKGGRVRYVPMTDRLRTALAFGRGRRQGRVLVNRDGGALTQNAIRSRLRVPCREAGVPHGVHTLRHTFCSHLAMRGATALAVKELAGHTSLTTTQMYMHLSPDARGAAIALLNAPGNNGGTVQAA
ncbi:MAG: tyrosine-type recombinase/integrase [Luteitalea sp.]